MLKTSLTIDFKQKMDLLALGYEDSADDSEIATCLSQLNWLESSNVLNRVIELTRLELEQQKYLLAQTSFNNKLSAIEAVCSEGMRQSNNHLTTEFISWYKEFCTYDEGGQLRSYSLKAIERGDHPDWSYSGDQSQSTPGRAGGKPGRRIAHLAATSSIIAYLAEEHPQYNKGQLWEEFITFAPEYAEYNGVKYQGHPVDFEIQENSSGERYLKAHYRDTSGKQQIKKIDKDTFQRELKKNLR